MVRHKLGVGVGCDAGFRGTAVVQYLQGVTRQRHSARSLQPCLDKATRARADQPTNQAHDVGMLEHVKHMFHSLGLWEDFSTLNPLASLS